MKRAATPHSCAGIHGSRRKWRRGWDSNPRYGSPYARFRGEYFQPLSHLSAVSFISVADGPEFRQRRAAGFVSNAHEAYENERATQRRFAEVALSPSSEKGLDEPSAILCQNSSGYLDAMV
jgi:hypothetical protein